MFDLTWMPDWFIVFAGLLIALIAIAFLLTPFFVMGMRFRIARLEDEVSVLREELSRASLTQVRVTNARADEWHTHAAPPKTATMPWRGQEAQQPPTASQPSVRLDIRPDGAYRGGTGRRPMLGASVPEEHPLEERSRSEPRLRWPPPK
ncbi:hypothetical protein D5366_01245 [Neokomagataea tanensis]|uniref:Uncharacterized protein n=1 Tax=Neokomagataea tanensis TaxID=661191 RepID=A0A4Y6V235_9PROT|nr:MULTISPECIES: hypothetical protein [Neokomagataea]QDH24112.1 hypothetical protein D5366_01245 [Neokomagataea tanensis]